MKKHFLKAFNAVTFLLVACCLAACNKEKEVENPNVIDVSDKLQIVLRSEDYQAEKEITRSAVMPDTQTVALDNGLTAEVSVEADKLAPTRAGTPLPDGRYTVYVLSGGFPMEGVNKRLTGTVTGGVFKRDPGSYMRLPHGTYTFVCHNDAFRDFGGMHLLSDGDENALIATTTATINSDDVFPVLFVMRHDKARLRIKLQTYVPFSNLTAEIRSTATVTRTREYGYDGNPRVTWFGMISYDTSFPATTEPTAGQLLYNSMGKYHYYWDDTEGDRLKLVLKDGTLYGKAVKDKELVIKNLPASLGRNTSYTVKIKITSPGTYLFEDGSTGELAYKGKRTPIGVVVRQRSASQEGIAVALKGATTNVVQWAPTMMGVQSNSSVFTETTFYNDMDGYKWTWEKEGSYDQTTIKANEQTLYPPFYAAAHYNPGIETSGTVGKWYLPARGEYKLFTDKFRALYPAGLAWDESAVNKVFTDAGGDLGQGGWTSTEGTDFKTVYTYLLAGQQIIPTSGEKEHTRRVRPFVHF